MYALKWAGALLLIVCGALCGLWLSSREKRRADLIEDYAAFLERARSLVHYCSAETAVIADQCRDSGSLGSIGDEFAALIAQGKDPQICWKTAVCDSAMRGEFFPEDTELLLSFGKGFGEGDSSSEESRLSFLIDKTSQRLEVLRAQTTERRKLYRIVGTFAGGLAAALLI